MTAWLSEKCVISCPALHIFVHPWAWIKQQIMYDNACFQVQHYKIVQFLEHEMTTKVSYNCVMTCPALLISVHPWGWIQDSVWQRTLSCPALRNCFLSRAWNHSITFQKVCDVLLSIADYCTTLGMKWQQNFLKLCDFMLSITDVCTS